VCNYFLVMVIDDVVLVMSLVKQITDNDIIALNVSCVQYDHI